VMLDVVSYNRMNPNDAEFVYASTTANSHGLDINQDPNVFYQVDEKEHFRTWPTLPGFSFLNKHWGTFSLDHVNEVVFDEKAFARLVLPQDKKSMIKALVEEYRKIHQKVIEETKRLEEEELRRKKRSGHHHDTSSNQVIKKQQNDFISLKGGGCIFLLHGVPGTGKTLTAEAVSEDLRIPLYMVTVGELGTSPQMLETTLQKILDLAATWNAAILLDEADIFLERRSKNDILRNAMVGIFLRLLEYHQGVLFLTTNRVDCLDDAFSSRISVALYYNELDKAARKQVWFNFIDLYSEYKDIQITPDDIEKLADYPLNGRQIRSCMRNALALANSGERPLKAEDVITTINLSLHFRTEYNNKGQQGEESPLALTNGKKKSKSKSKAKVLHKDAELNLDFQKELDQDIVNESLLKATNAGGTGINEDFC